LKLHHLKNSKKSKFVANARKKPTKAERKSRVLKFSRYAKPKRLADMVPLIDDVICDKLRAECGRNFSNNFIKQRTMSMGIKPDLDYVHFNSMAGYIGYMGKALTYELHDAVKTEYEGFTLVANLTAEDMLWKQKERYLAEVEETAIRHVSPNNQFRAKLTNTLERSTAYNLLLAMQSTSEVDNTLVMSLKREIELTKYQKEVVLAQAQAVFNSGGLENGRAIEKVEFAISEGNTAGYGSSGEQAMQQGLPALTLPKGNWGKICAAFISKHEGGEALYNHWLAKLSVVEEVDTIELSTSSNMVRDRIEQTYLQFLVKVACEFGINRMEVVLKRDQLFLRKLR